MFGLADDDDVLDELIAASQQSQASTDPNKMFAVNSVAYNLSHLNQAGTSFPASSQSFGLTSLPWYYYVGAAGLAVGVYFLIKGR